MVALLRFSLITVEKTDASSIGCTVINTSRKTEYKSTIDENRTFKHVNLENVDSDENYWNKFKRRTEFSDDQQSLRYSVDLTDFATIRIKKLI